MSASRLSVAMGLTGGFLLITLVLGHGSSTRRLHRDVYAELRDAVVEALLRFHAESPLETTMPQVEYQKD